MQEAGWACVLWEAKIPIIKATAQAPAEGRPGQGQEPDLHQSLPGKP